MMMTYTKQKSEQLTSKSKKYMTQINNIYEEHEFFLRVKFLFVIPEYIWYHLVSYW